MELRGEGLNGGRAFRGTRLQQQMRPVDIEPLRVLDAAHDAHRGGARYHPILGRAQHQRRCSDLEQCGALVRGEKGGVVRNLATTHLLDRLAADERLPLDRVALDAALADKTIILGVIDLNDPAVGESVSNTGGIVDVFPWLKHRLFARAGIGWASYTNNRPTGTNGNGLGWEAGAGYKIPLRGHLALAPVVEYAAGGLGTAYDPVAPITGRKYSVVEFKLAAVYHFGGRSR